MSVNSSEFKFYEQFSNFSRPSDAYMHRQTKPPLFQITAFRLFGTEPLCQVYPEGQTSVKL